MNLTTGRLARIHQRVGNTLAFCGWARGAVQAYHDALRAAPGFVEAHFRLGEALARQGCWHEASRAFGEAACLAPGSSEAHGNLVLALGRAGRLDAAVAALHRLIRLRPGEPELHVLRAALLLRLRRPGEAIAALRWAARLPASAGSTRFFLGEALLGAEAWWAAAAALRAAQALVSSPPSRSRALRLAGALNRIPAAIKARPVARRTADQPAFAALVGRVAHSAVGVSTRVGAGLKRTALRAFGSMNILIGLLLASHSPHRAIRSLRNGARFRTA